MASKNSISIVYFLTIFYLKVIIADSEENDRLIAELELDDLELQEACEAISAAAKDAMLTQSFKEKLEAEERYGEMLKVHRENLKEFVDIPSDLERNWTYMVKPGDGIMPSKNWSNFITFKNHIDERSSQIKLPCLNQSDDCLFSKSHYHRILKSSTELPTLRDSWSVWQTIYNDSDVATFATNLHFVKTAATQNDLDTVQEYWEFLLDYPNAYARAIEFWEEIQPFYRKFYDFVKKRLFQHYGIEEEQHIPVYLLGDRLGSDWSDIAGVVLPHPQLHYDAETFLKYKSVEDIYRYAERISRTMSLGRLGDKFWQHSNFNASVCGPQVFEFYTQRYTEIHECDTPSWQIYLDAHEVAMRVALNNKDYSSLPRQQLRYLPLDDAVYSLGSLLAIENLHYNDIVDKETFNSDSGPANMTKLMLAALRFMPKLPYYLAADLWRLKELRNNNTGDVKESWWKFSQEYQGIRGITGKEAAFLDDSHILANKPYLSKFFGTVMAFQLLEYYQDQSEDISNVVEDFGKDQTFETMLKERSTTEWPKILTFNYGLDLSPSSLVKYFQPLEDYFESAPSEQVSPVPKTTTTTSTEAPTTTPTTTTTTTISPDVKEANETLLQLSDQPRNMSSMEGAKSEVKTAGDSIGMYVGLALLAVVACLLVAGFMYKKMKRKRRTNNRRFDT